MRRAGATAAVLGIALVAWSLLTLVWQEPITAIEHLQAQRVLAATLAVRDRAAHVTARRYRLESRSGEVMGRIAIPRIGLDAVVVDGTTEPDLAKGPGFYRGDYLPGEGRLVYIAGHRTIFGAPFSHLDALRRGDLVVLTMPYGRFTYRVTGHRIVPATALWVLRTGRHEQLILQTCHPRYSASHRYLVYATPDQGGE
jgi:sortase A